MRFARIVLAAAAAAGLVACAFQNGEEREAQRITQAVVNNDLRPVQNDIAKGIAISRVQVAQWSDEFNSAGKLISVKETTANCEPGWHCFDVKFAKHEYTERMRYDEHSKVVDWSFHMAPAQ